MRPSATSSGSAALQNIRRRTRAPIVILADDDTDFRRMVALALRADGSEVHEVADGRELFDALSPYILDGEWGKPLDLVISDLRMPHFSGLEVLQSLRDKGWDTPFVLLTAFADAETLRSSARLGATAVLGKPVDMSQLLSIVRGLTPCSAEDAA